MIIKDGVLFAPSFFVGDFLNSKKKYISMAFVLLASTITVKIIGAVYKIPLTSFIGAVGRGYFAYAYNLCLPIHAVTMGALPVALSKLVSKYSAKGDESAVAALKKGSFSLFVIIGFIGMLLMLALAKPYSVFIAHSPKTIYTILVLAPSILFSCIAASYRGYYEGLMNMLPTAVSQTIEAVSKMIFGLVFAKFSMSFLYNEFLQKGTVVGISASTPQQALSLIYPFTSACAMAGVAFGGFLSLIYLMVYNSIKKESICTPLDTKSAKKELLSFSFPIMVSVSVQSVFQFFDTATIRLALSKVPDIVLKSSYSDALKFTKLLSDDISTYVFGLLSSALDFKNLVPGVTMALGVCAVPVISNTLEKGDKNKLYLLVNNIFKYTVILSSFGGIALAFCSKEILTLFYGKNSMDIVVGTNSIVRNFAFTVPLYSLAGTAVFSVQAIGHPEKSIITYAVSGIIRVILNLILVSRVSLLLNGCVISGAAGYLLLSIWNIAIVCKYCGIKFRVFSVCVSPLIISAVSYLFSNWLSLSLPLSDNIFLLLIEKGFVITTIFYILCFLCGLLNFRDIFSYFAHKKIS